MNGFQLQQDEIVRAPGFEATRRRRRRRRGWAIGGAMAVPVGWLSARWAAGRSLRPVLPAAVRQHPELAMLLLVVAALAGSAVLLYAAAGRSPHTVLRPDDSSVRLADVVGAAQTKREAVDTLNLFLNHRRFREQMGGAARRGVLFTGPSGTGKTHLAMALAAEAGVPFLHLSATEFQSMFPGQTSRKVRAFFRSLRTTARAHGGAIGFIDDFDAIGSSRAAVAPGDAREGRAGAVHELLAQMQRSDTPGRTQQLADRVVCSMNRLLPERAALPRPVVRPANVLLVAATNRAADLDAAFMRPGRFDRTIHFDLPPRADRVQIAEYYLARKRHDHTVSAAFVADVTAGYTPVRIERLLDESLVVALQQGHEAMSYQDVLAAQMVTEVGAAHDVGYHPEEKRRMAMHEAGHALVAALAGRDVKLASVLRRSGTLGLVAHGDVEERHLRTPSETADLLAVMLAGRAAEIQEFGEAGSGIADDLADATTIAAQMVGALGAGGSLLSLDVAHVPGAGNLVAKVMADATSRGRAERLLHTAADRSACTLLEHRRALLALADALCDHDELSGDQVHAIVAGSMVT
ncbi:MAG: AAA family ATPase [Actinomycetota bacterium]|nr:AAA family ATPase [Actinomycetota bacterium]